MIHRLDEARARVALATWALAALCGGGCSASVEQDAVAPSTESVVSTEAVQVSGKAPAASRGFRSVVSFVRESEPNGASKPDSGSSPGMDQFSREFYPDVLVALPGQSVEFANSEEEMHNVHVRAVATGETVFNVGTPAGATYRHRFEVDGAYHVTCDVHSEMEAFIVVVPGSSVKADKDGAFEIEGLAPGKYRVLVWSADASLQHERSITIEEGARVLDLSSPP